jgi:hypothetical protein
MCSSNAAPTAPTGAAGSVEQLLPGGRRSDMAPSVTTVHFDTDYHLRGQKPGRLTCVRRLFESRCVGQDFAVGPKAAHE